MPNPPSPPPSAEANQLLENLRREEELLGRARDLLAELNAALRKADMPAVQALLWSQEAMVSGLAGRAEERARAAAALAAELNMPFGACTLRTLAERLPDPWAPELRDMRVRFLAVTREIAEWRSRNANLIESLRQFGRSVVSGIVPSDSAPVRYGPSGVRLGAPLSTGFSASG